MSKKKFLLGATTGALIGAAAVIFTTPQSGQQVRSKIKQNIHTAQLNFADVKDQSKHVIQAITTLSNEVKYNIPPIINELKDSFSAFQVDIQPNVENLQQEIDQLNSSIGEIEKNLNDFNQKNSKQPIIELDTNSQE